MVYCGGGGTSFGSTHSVIISNDARFSGRALKRLLLPPWMMAVPAMTVLHPFAVDHIAPDGVIPQHRS